MRERETEWERDRERDDRKKSEGCAREILWWKRCATRELCPWIIPPWRRRGKGEIIVSPTRISHRNWILQLLFPHGDDSEEEESQVSLSFFYAWMKWDGLNEAGGQTLFVAYFLAVKGNGRKSVRVIAVMESLLLNAASIFVWSMFLFFTMEQHPMRM